MICAATDESDAARSAASVRGASSGAAQPRPSASGDANAIWIGSVSRRRHDLPAAAPGAAIGCGASPRKRRNAT